MMKLIFIVMILTNSNYGGMLFVWHFLSNIHKMHHVSARPVKLFST